jgi:AcrR family transcriptional regulator
MPNAAEESKEEKEEDTPKDLLSEYRDEYRKKMRQTLLKAALEVFIENSQKGFKYDNVKAEEIADRAGVSRATIYNYFKSREEIYAEIGNQGLREIIETYQTQAIPDASGLDQILKLCEVELRTIMERPFYQEIWRHFLIADKEKEAKKCSDEALNEKEAEVKIAKPCDEEFPKFSVKTANYIENVQTAISKGLEDGSINSELNIEQITQFLWMILSGIFDQFNLRKQFLPNMGLPVERIIQLTIGLIRNLLEGEK